MKLGKTLIITGLLFSSVLGSVNVNNITAMAAADGSQPVNTDNKVVNINFTLKGGSPVGDDEFTASAKPSVEVKNSDTTVSKEKVQIPYNYKIISGDTPYTITKDASEKDTITVEVENIPMESVNAQYFDEKGNELDAKTIESKNLPTSFKLKNSKKQVKKENLNDLPDGFKVEYSNGTLKLTKIEAPTPQHPKPPSPQSSSSSKTKSWWPQRLRTTKSTYLIHRPRWK